MSQVERLRTRRFAARDASTGPLLDRGELLALAQRCGLNVAEAHRWVAEQMRATRGPTAPDPTLPLFPGAEAAR